VGEVKESIDDFDYLIKMNSLLDLIFGVLIQRQDKDKANQQHPVFSFHFKIRNLSEPEGSLSRRPHSGRSIPEESIRIGVTL
jgi:hypothetical protein